GGLVPSASIMLDRSIIEQFGNLLVDAPVGDWLIQVLATYEGQGLLFIDKKMSVYRSMSLGSWSSKRMLDLGKFFSMLDQMDEYMNHQYSKEIYQAKKRLYYSAGRLALAKGDFLESRMFILKSLWVGDLLIKSVVVYFLSFFKIKV
ncbi:MAG: hypothetical protein IE909_19505, partial [Campylobacterales bacterium]|nr:hypothetical protein [Campylobacterales bacterium]